MSRESVSVVIDVLSYLTLFGQIISGVLLIALVWNRILKKKLPKQFSQFSNNALPFVLLVATIATLGSLFLSEIAHFTPCKLCWYQRIFMYPIVILGGMAIWKSDLGIRRYIMPLSIIGLAIAIYHYALQMYPALPCSDEVASCSFKQFANFGYITIPMMSLTAFLMILLSLFFIKEKGSRK